MKLKSTEIILNDFLNALDLYDDEQLESIIHVINTELMERAYMENPDAFGEGGYEN
jgi:hypothetical protein